MSTLCYPEEEVSSRVIEAVAEATDVDPLAVHPPLYEAVDPDALDALYEGESTGPHTEFEFGGCLVTIDKHGQVTATTQ